jgi:hypothetical protein
MQSCPPSIGHVMECTQNKKMPTGFHSQSEIRVPVQRLLRNYRCNFYRLLCGLSACSDVHHFRFFSHFELC